MREQLNVTAGVRQERVEYRVVDRTEDPIGWIRLQLGDERIKQLFGFDKAEFEDALEADIPDSIRYPADIAERVKKSLWKIHSFSRDTERLREGTELWHELPMALHNLRTLIEEYLWSNNSVFEMKVVRGSEGLKLVSYDSATMDGEGFEEAVRREGVDEMVERFERMKAAEDDRYARDEGGLRSRDRSEYALMQDLKQCAARVLNGETLPMLVSMSPGPDKSEYADSIGYATGIRFSHLRSYQFKKVSDQEVVITASTIFHYAPLWKQRMFAFEHAREFVNSGLPLVGFKHVDFLRAPFFMNQASVSEIEGLLNGKQAFDWLLSGEVRQKIEDHRLRRLDTGDHAYRDERMKYLTKKYVWLYVLLTVKEAPLVARMQVLMDLLNDEKDSFTAYILEKEQKIKGRRYTTEEIEERVQTIDSVLGERARGGMCPTLSTQKTEGIEDDELSSEMKECVLKCGGFKQDGITGSLQKCLWQAKAEKGKVYECCPECGWVPGKVQNFAPRTLEKPVRENLSEFITPDKKTYRNLEPSYDKKNMIWQDAAEKLPWGMRVEFDRVIDARRSVVAVHIGPAVIKRIVNSSMYRERVGGSNLEYIG